MKKKIAGYPYQKKQTIAGMKGMTQSLLASCLLTATAVLAVKTEIIGQNTSCR